MLKLHSLQVVDVTMRYTRAWKDVLQRRTLCSESKLVEIIGAINEQIKSSLSPSYQSKILARSPAEIYELMATLVRKTCPYALSALSRPALIFCCSLAVVIATLLCHSFVLRAMDSVACTVAAPHRCAAD